MGEQGIESETSWLVGNDVTSDTRDMPRMYEYSQRTFKNEGPENRQ